MAPRPGMPPGISVPQSPPTPPPQLPPSPVEGQHNEMLVEPLWWDEAEIVFKPHVKAMGRHNAILRTLSEKAVRYIKTTINATVNHLKEYLQLRLSRELRSRIKVTDIAVFIQRVPDDTLVELKGNQTLRSIRRKYPHTVARPIALYYSCKKV